MGCFPQRTFSSEGFDNKALQRARSRAAELSVGRCIPGGRRLSRRLKSDNENERPNRVGGEFVNCGQPRIGQKKRTIRTSGPSGRTAGRSKSDILERETIGTDDNFSVAGGSKATREILTRENAKKPQQRSCEQATSLNFPFSRHCQLLQKAGEFDSMLLSGDSDLREIDRGKTSVSEF